MPPIAVVIAASLASIPLVGDSSAAATLVSQTFEYTGEPQQFVVPDGVENVAVDACGAQGEDLLMELSVGTEVGVGGRGGRAISSLDVHPGEILTVEVGGRDGYNGGGSVGVGAASGGGASDVRRGGATLADRVVIGGGGGGGGGLYAVRFFTGYRGGGGGGLVGGTGVAGSAGGTQTEAGGNGGLGVGGPGQPLVGGPGATGEAGITSGGGGGGGLFGGGGGGGNGNGITFWVGPGSGGSGLGDLLATDMCTGDGVVTIWYDDPLPSILPSGAAGVEGDAGSAVWQVPVRLSQPSALPVTVDWATGTLPDLPGNAQAGTDFVAASGTVTFDPGEIEVFVPIEILGDTDDEPPLLWGEWGVIEFSDPTNAVIDTGPFFGLGLFIIFDDD